MGEIKVKKYEYQLKLPTYEELKALPFKKEEDEYGIDYIQYTIHLFEIPTGDYGRFTLNEDDEGLIIFDFIEDGYSGRNNFEKTLKFNKKNYQEMCKHANWVYNEFFRELLSQEYYVKGLY